MARHKKRLESMTTKSEGVEKRARYVLHVCLAISYALHVYNGYTMDKYTQDNTGYAIVTFVIVMLVSCSALYFKVSANIQQILFAGIVPALLISSTYTENDKKNLKYTENDKKTADAIHLTNGFVVACSVLVTIISSICMAYNKVSKDRILPITLSLIGYIIRIIHQFQRVGVHFPSSQLISFLTAVAIQRRDSSLCSCCVSTNKTGLPYPYRHKRCGVFTIILSALAYGVVCAIIKGLNNALSFYDILIHCFHFCGVSFAILLVERCFDKTSKMGEFRRKVTKVFISLLSSIYTLCHAYCGIHTQQLMDSHLGFMLAFAMT